MTKADGTVIINTKIDTSGMNSGLKQIQGNVGGLGSALKKLGGIIATVFAAKKIAEFAASCIELGSDLDEVQNVVDVTFGKMSGAIEQFSKEAATQFGLSELSAKQYTSTLGAMYKSMGFTEDAAAGMSIEMAKLTGDMASFYNLDADTAFQKIRSGISGETEPLKQLGINLSEANLEEFRLAQGIQTSYKAMSQQDKALLRYNYLLSVTKDAQGDFARTSGSWANQIKILRLQFDSIRADLGQGFIAIFTPVLQVINRILQGLAKLASAFKAFTQLITGKKSSSGGGGSGAANLGVDETMPEVADTYSEAADSADDYADATQDVAKATKQAAKEANKYLSPLDEINRYTKENAESDASAVPGVSGGGGKTKTKTPAASTGSGTGASTLAPVDFGQLEQGDTVVDKLAQKMKNLYDTIVKGCQPAINALKNLWDNGLKELGEFAFNSLLDFYNLFLKPVGAWVMGEGIPRFVNALNEGLMKVNWEAIRAGLQNLWKALAPFAVTVGEGLLWLWENVLVPFGTWTANEVVPRFFQTLASVVTIVNNVLTALQPAWQWFWDNVLGPIASWTGGIFLTIWDGINAALGWFAQWCADNPETVKQIAASVALFFAAWKIPALVAGIGTLATTLGPGGLLVGAIAAAIAAGTWLYKNWDTIKQKAKELKDWLAGRFGEIGKQASETWTYFKTETVKTWTTVRTFLGTLLQNIVSGVTTKFESIRKTIADKWSLVTTGVKTTWNSITAFLTGIWNGFITKATTIFGNVKKAIEDKWTLITTGVKTVWNGITTFLNGIWTGFVTTVTEKFNSIKTAIGDAWDAISTAVTNVFGGEDGIVAKVKGFFGDIKDNILGVFTGEEGIVTKFGGFMDDLVAKVLGIHESMTNAFAVVFGGIMDVVKAPINAVIGFINYMIESVVTGVNDIIGSINSLGFDMPSWMGGASFHPNIPLITSYYQIPLLAKGAVIPPNAPFMAMLGDQKRGTNIEAPLETIQQAVANVVGSGDQHITIYLDGKVVYENVLKRGRDQQIWSGHNPFELA